MSPTRRRFLQLTVPAAVGLSGCARSEPSSHPNGDDSAGGQSRGTVSDPDVHKPRNREGGPVLLESDGDADGVDQSGTGIRRQLVTSRDQAAGFAFADGVTQADVESTRAFFDETAFDEETIYVTHAGIESCTQYRIHAISWGPNQVDYEYCRELRPPEDDCIADAREQVALCIRIPEALEMTVRGAGSSGRSPCRETDTEYETIDPDGSEADE
ncbi:hypothetical protein AB7C87_03350 [Natrarchaeobius sp. A-rgal3]|uniref:hypothetical protein n=1 Tax=Natrarchaeobius versutus TaxID=1679078 RepID=UPI003510CF27